MSSFHFGPKKSLAARTSLEDFINLALMIKSEADAIRLAWKAFLESPEDFLPKDDEKVSYFWLQDVLSNDESIEALMGQKDLLRCLASLDSEIHKEPIQEIEFAGQKVWKSHIPDRFCAEFRQAEHEVKRLFSAAGYKKNIKEKKRLAMKFLRRTGRSSPIWMGRWWNTSCAIS